MASFKPGDKVECINNSGYSDRLTIGEVYTVEKVRSGDYIDLRETMASGWKASRFKIWIPPPPPFDMEMALRYLRGFRDNCCAMNAVNHAELSKLITEMEKAHAKASVC